MFKQNKLYYINTYIDMHIYLVYLFCIFIINPNRITHSLKENFFNNK